MNYTALLQLPESGKFFAFVLRRLSGLCLPAVADAALWTAVTVGAVFLPETLTAGALGTTGKIAGTVTDAGNREPLIGASVLLEGTKFGARTDLDGNYNILNVPPGTYRVKASYVGYKDKIISNIRVSADLTARADFELSNKELESKEIVITAERPLVTKDLTNTQSVVSSDEIKTLPIQDFNQVVELQAGIVDGRFRGGRKGEVAYLVDGVSVTDVFNGNQGRENSTGVEPNAIQEVQVISGAFNAEFGQAMSGIVNIVTKDGGEKYSGTLTGFTGDFLSNRTVGSGSVFTGDGFPYIDRVNPVSERNLDGSFSGPVPGMGDQLSFYTNVRYFENEGRFFGTNKFATDDVTFLPASPDLVLVKRREGGSIITDTLNTAQSEQSGYNFGNAGTGDGSPVPLNPYRRFSGLAKLTWRPSGTLKIAGSLLASDEQFKNYDFSRQLSPQGVPNNFRRSYTGIINATQTLTTNTFFNLALSSLYSQERSYLYEDPLDPRYQPAGGYSPSQAFDGTEFVIGGTNNNQYRRSTFTLTAKADVTSQIDQINQVKGGIELRRHEINLLSQDVFFITDPNDPTRYIQDVRTIDNSAGGGFDEYVHRPIELSAYLQDKLEFKSFTVNAGIRLDYFTPDGIVPNDPSDPGLFNSIITGENFNTPEARERRLQSAYRSARSTFAISPRLGIAVPITDRSIMHFSYGNFFQIPNFEFLYRNPYFRPDRSNSTSGPFGNAELKPQKTTSAEIGIQQQFGADVSVDLTLYFRDIRDLNSTGGEIIGYANGDRYIRFSNADYGVVRGAIVSLSRRFSQSFSFNVDYTFQIAQGNASDPQTAFDAVKANQPVATQLVALDWDQRHTANFTLTYQNSGWLASMIARYGSGYPYTPNADPPGRIAVTGTSQGAILTNTSRTPETLGIDLRLARDFQLEGFNLNAYVQITNLLDAPNQRGNFGGLLSPDLYIENIERSGRASSYNTPQQYYTRPDFFAEPRKVLFGLGVFF